MNRLITAILVAASPALAGPAEPPTRPLPDVIGITHVNGQYHLGDRDFLNEGAGEVLALGSRVIKLWFHKPWQSYPYNSRWPTCRSLVDIARTPYFREVFHKPFTTYILMCFSMGRPAGYFIKGITPEQAEDEQRQFYELARYLLSTYKGSGKTFVIQHWEGDWLVRGSFDRNAEPAPAALEAMITWLNARQAGISRARDQIGCHGVRVYHAAEVNRVVASMRQGRPGLVNKVLPRTRLDLVSYSAWDAATAGYKDPNLQRRALDYIAENTPDSPDFGDKNVYIGEFGMPENSYSLARIQKAIPNAVETALRWGCPYVVYWQLYCNELSDSRHRRPVQRNDQVRGFWLIRPDGSKAWTWHYFHGLLTGKAQLYVHPAGSDTWSGTLPEPDPAAGDGPFRTLGRARQAVRSLKRTGRMPAGATVHIRGGTYPLAETLELTAADSGTAEGPVVYRAFDGEKVRITGARNVSGFKPVSDPAVLARIEPACRAKILQARLKSQGITDFGRLTPRGFGRPTYPAALELFYRDRPMQLARWPNDGWATIAAVPGGKDAGCFRYEGDRPERWAKAEDIWLHGYWTYDWADSYEKVEAIDTRTRQIRTRKPHGAYGYTAGKRFYALNILEELDEPGEWYLDRDKGILYFWPPGPVEDGAAAVSVLEGPLVSMEGASWITLEGLVLEGTRGTAVTITGGTGDLLTGCIIRNTGNAAVVIRDGKKNGVTGCTIYNTGDGGIALVGGDRKSLEPAGHFADNNHIHHYSRWCRTYRPAIRLAGVGNHAANNLIHHGPHTAVLFGGNNHLLEYNEIHNVCYETGDVGAFYTGRDWTTRGTVIRYNYFHDIHGPYTHGAMAVYLDDAASGTTIFGNIFYKASRAAFIGGGRDNTVENNIFIDCNPAVHIDARGLGWAKSHIAKGGSWQMYRKLEAVAFDRPPYSTRYPALAEILQDDPAAPKGNVVLRNICCGGKWIELPGVDKALVTIQDNLVEADPRFVDAEKLDFRLRKDSPAWKLGFKPIPVERIGYKPRATARVR